jgi:hypothetical protein
MKDASHPEFYDGWSHDRLVEKILWLQEALWEQHGAVSDAARRWRKIGYDTGYSAGYDEATKEMA